jgi:integrase
MKIRGLVRRRGGALWFAQQKDGVRTWHNLHTTDESEALGRLAELRQSAALTRRSLETAMTAVAPRWPNKKTLRGYQWVITDIVRRLGNLDVSKVTPDRAVIVYQAWLTDTSEASAQSYLRAASAVWVAFIAAGYTTANPWTRIPRTKTARTRGADFLTIDTRDQMVAAATGPLLTCLLLGFYAGLRRLEIAEARRDWIDFQAACLRVRPAVTAPRLRAGQHPFRIKDKAERLVPLHPILRAHLEGVCAELEPHDFIVCPKVRHGKSDYRYDFRVPAEKLCAELGIKGFSAHVLRRTFASLLVQAGVSLTKVSLWLGDDYRVVVEHYAHLSPSDTDIESL